MIVRQPAVAGMFYPGESSELKSAVLGYLQHADVATESPKAMIVPHAGYVYSGPVAASAYRCLEKISHQISRVVLLGPSHRVPLMGLAVSNADCFATPLGEIELDRESIDEILSLPQVRNLDEAHSMEHSLEVQLPFLQLTLDSFKLVPIVVGDASPDEVCEVLERLWGGAETLIVISSDLSHYHDYPAAQAMDRKTSQAIEALQPEQIQYDDACGRNPVNGLLKAAQQHGLKVRTVDLRNSGDTAGPRDEVVGYGAYLFYS